MDISIYGTVIDDWVENSDPELSYGWSQICDKHVKEFPECMIDFGSGSGICGVKGCNREAVHYMDFDFEDIDDPACPFCGGEVGTFSIYGGRGTRTECVACRHIIKEDI